MKKENDMKIPQGYLLIKCVTLSLILTHLEKRNYGDLEELICELNTNFTYNSKEE